MEVKKDTYERLELIANQQLDERDYWLEKMSGELLRSSFFEVGSRKFYQGYEFEEMKFIFPDMLNLKLINLSNDSDEALYFILLSGIILLLNRHTANKDIIVGSPVLREDDEGNFINKFIAIRNKIEDDRTFKEFLLQCQRTVIEAYQYANYPIEILVHQLNLKAEEGFPLFDVVVLVENIHKREDISQLQNNVTIIFYRKGKKISCMIQYNSKRYDVYKIKSIFNQLEILLQEVLLNLDIKIFEVSILSRDEKKKILNEFNNTKSCYCRDKTIDKLFEEQVEKAPDNIAAVYDQKELTYKELNNQANRLAYNLKNRGVKRDSIVGLMVERSIEMIVGIIGIIKSGGGYLPIDPGYPVERISFFLRDSNPEIMLTNRRFINNIEFNKTQIYLDEDESYMEGFSNLRSLSDPTDLLYIIYTSGTTGKPKGAMVGHRNVVGLFFNDKFNFSFNRTDIWILFHSQCFDFSVWEMYGALLFGSKLVIISKNVVLDTSEFLDVLKRECVTILNQTPSAFYNLLNEEIQCKETHLDLKYLIFGGEKLKPVKLKKWYERYPSTKIINMYGITETTVHVTYKEITAVDIESNAFNIGKPLPTACAYIMGNNLILQPIGVTGELYVGGEGVCRGYLNSMQLTSEKFIEDRNTSAGRIYRSGDLARYYENGELEYIGRLDYQVQLRGFRIELGEIESHLLKYGKVKDAIVIVRKSENNGKYLCAYIVSDHEIEVPELREYLSNKLPGYMVPSFFIRIEKIEMTPNGKVNRNLLPPPAFEVGKNYVPPRSDLEKCLVELWARVLDISEDLISIDANFFELGGNSIKINEVNNSLKKTLRRDIPVVKLYTYPTIRSLIGYFDSNRNNRNESIPANDRMEIIENKRNRLKERTRN